MKHSLDRRQLLGKLALGVPALGIGLVASRPRPAYAQSFSEDQLNRLFAAASQIGDGDIYQAIRAANALWWYNLPADTVPYYAPDFPSVVYLYVQDWTHMQGRPPCNDGERLERSEQMYRLQGILEGASTVYGAAAIWAAAIAVPGNAPAGVMAAALGATALTLRGLAQVAKQMGDRIRNTPCQ